MADLIPFNYDQLDPKIRKLVQWEGQEFDHNMSEAGVKFIHACHNLKRIQELLKYKRPGFVEWCNSKFDLSNGTVYRMLDVANMFPNLGNIPPIESPSALYLLAA